MWSLDKRHGQGTYWRMEAKKLRREYTGDWFENKISKGISKNIDDNKNNWITEVLNDLKQIPYNTKDIFNKKIIIL